MVDFTVIPEDATHWALRLDITNTATAVPASTADILTGIYFDLTAVGQGALGMSSAIATSGIIDATHQTPGTQYNVGTNICADGKGGTALNNSCTANVAGGWEAGYWAGGISSVNSSLAGTQKYGVGTVGGGGLFMGQTNRTGNANYGIAPAAGINVVLSNVGNMAPYSYRTASITLTGLTTPNIRISNVLAGYGGTNEAMVWAVDTSTPEPGTWLMMACGLGGVAWWRRRKPVTSSDAS
jgi:hypothetical protein